MYKVKRFSQSFGEPISWNEALGSYPKISDLSNVIRNQDKLAYLNSLLDEERIYVDPQVLMSDFHDDSAVMDASGRILVLYGDDESSLYFDTRYSKFIKVTKDNSSFFNRSKEEVTSVSKFCNEILDGLIDSARELSYMEDDEDILKSAEDIYGRMRRLI